MRCELCGYEGPVYLVPMSSTPAGYVCRLCLEDMTKYTDDGDDELICDCCGEPVKDAYVEAGGEVWCMKCIEETREYEATY